MGKILSYNTNKENDKVTAVIIQQVDLEPKGKLHILIQLTEKLVHAQPPREFKERFAFGLDNKRRGAIRRRVYQVKGHKFMVTLLLQPTYCSQCQNFIWGITAFQCQGNVQ